MMDISMPSLAPVVVADLRPSADAAATARIDRPVMAFVPGALVAPPSLVQEGLVTKGFMEPEGPAPVAPVVGLEGLSGDAPQRVLKPWGIPLLPFEKNREEASSGAGVEAGPTADMKASGDLQPGGAPTPAPTPQAWATNSSSTDDRTDAEPSA